MKPLIVKNQVQINRSVSVVWEVLTSPSFIKQWDELPDDFNTDSPLNKGDEIVWHQPDGQLTKLMVAFCVPNKLLKLNLYRSKWPMPEQAYDIAYYYTLLYQNGVTKLEIEIGDFSVLPDGEKYYNASVEFGTTAIEKIKELSLLT